MATVYSNVEQIVSQMVGGSPAMGSITEKLATRARGYAAPHNITGEELHGISVERDGDDWLIVLEAEAAAAREFGHQDRGGGHVEGLHILGRLL